MYERKHKFCTRGSLLRFALPYCSSQRYGVVSPADSCKKFQSNLIHSARRSSGLSRKPLPNSVLRQAGGGICVAPHYCHPKGGPWGHILPGVMRREWLPTSPSPGSAAANGAGGSQGRSGTSVPSQGPGWCHGAHELPEEHPAAPKPTRSSAPPAFPPFLHPLRGGGAGGTCGRCWKLGQPAPFHHVREHRVWQVCRGDEDGGKASPSLEETLEAADMRKAPGKGCSKGHPASDAEYL